MKFLFCDYLKSFFMLGLSLVLGRCEQQTELYINTAKE